MFCYKIHKVSGKNDVVLAICDSELKGKLIREDPPFRVSEEFYGKNECNENEVLEIMKKGNVINIVGKKIVNLSLEKKLITKENVILIGDIPHAQFVW